MFDVHPEQYQQLLTNKVSNFNEKFSNFDIPEIDVFESPAQHFRMRAEFRIWRTKDEIHYVMFDQNDNRKPIFLNNFPRAHASISDLMEPLLNAIKSEEILKKRLFQIDFLCNLAGETLATLIYHKKLNDDWRVSAKILEEQLNIKIIGRAKKQKEVLSEDFITETLIVNGKTLHYQQVENSFTQPNAIICQDMLTWVVKNSTHLKGDLLELYCGNGNFTLALSENFNRILATEISKVSVKSARYNIELNKINNVEIVRMSSEEITQALNKEREFRRLANIELDDYQFSTIFVDPPRAGLDNETINLAKKFENIIYISCNPNTLVDNLNQFSEYTIKQIALFDQFPYTDHIECGLILARQKATDTA